MKLNLSNIIIFLCIAIGYNANAFQYNSKHTRDNQPPNIINIFMDDLGYGDLSSYGHPTIAILENSKLNENHILDGFNLSTILKGKKKETIRNHFIYYRKQEIYAVRKEAYKTHYITQT